MIHQVFEAMTADINRFLKSKHDITEDKVVASSIMNADGSIAIQEPDKVIMTLANIETDRMQSNIGNYKKTPKGFVKEKPAINVNMTVVFSAYFSSENYLEGLKFISSIIAYFQSNSGNFTPKNMPALSTITDRITAELISLDARDLNNLWGPLGSKYMPSVIYKVKTLPIRHELPVLPTPIIVKT